DFLFTHPPRNELGDLGTKINDENLVVFGEPLGAAAGYAGGIEEGHCNLCAGATRPVKAMFCDKWAFDAPATAPSSPHEHGNVEPVGLGTARGHQHPLLGYERSGTEHMRVLKRARNVGRRDKRKIPLPR